MRVGIFITCVESTCNDPNISYCLHALTKIFFFREWQISWFLHEYSWRNSTIVSVTIICGKYSSYISVRTSKVFYELLKMPFDFKSASLLTKQSVYGHINQTPSWAIFALFNVAWLSENLHIFTYFAWLDHGLSLGLSAFEVRLLTIT